MKGSVSVNIHSSDRDLLRSKQMSDASNVSVEDGVVKRIALIQRNVSRQLRRIRAAIRLIIPSSSSSICVPALPRVARRSTRRAVRRAVLPVTAGRGDVRRGGGGRGSGGDGILNGSGDRRGQRLMMTPRRDGGRNFEKRRIRRRLAIIHA